MCSGFCNNWVTRQHARCNNKNMYSMYYVNRYCCDIPVIHDNSVTTQNLRFFQERLLKVLKCYNFLWVQRRHNCSPAASFANCVMTLYLLKCASANVSFYTNNSKIPKFWVVTLLLQMSDMLTPSTFALKFSQILWLKRLSDFNFCVAGCNISF